MRKSALHDRMIARGAVMGAAFGWERPIWFSSSPGDTAVASFRRPNWFEPVAAEIRAVTSGVALADLSVFSKFEVSGPDVAAFLATLGANTPPKPGRVGLVHMLTPAGGVLSEFTVAHLSDNLAYLTSAAAAQEIDHDALRAHAADFDVTVTDVTDALGVLGVMGPASRRVLETLTDADLTNDFAWLSTRRITVAGVAVRALRVSYIGELGWELHAAAADMGTLFDAVEAAGSAQGHEVGFYGAYAANSMRLEKGYRGWGADLTTERTPGEAGLSAFVKPDGRCYAGREAALARDHAATGWAMVLLDIDAGPADPFYAHSVFAGDNAVGMVTSGSYGHRTGRVLALAYLRDRSVQTGLSVEILGRRHDARILERAPYDPDNLRLKG